MHHPLSPCVAQEARKFARPLGLDASAVFGGSGVANQISELKRGVEVSLGLSESGVAGSGSSFLLCLLYLGCIFRVIFPFENVSV